MTDFTTRLAQWETDSPFLRQVRTQVFVVEQKVPPSLEWDGLDPECLHAIALADKVPIGTGRLSRDGHIGRVAVLAEWRGRGIGDSLIHELLKVARARGDRECVLNAQTHALDFYTRFGFVAEGEEFQDAGIPHRTMRLQLTTQQIPLSSQSALEAAAIRVALNANYRLDVLTSVLGNTVLSSAQVLNVVRRLALSSSRASVRVLFGSWDRADELSQAIVQLRATLPSRIHLRRIQDEEISSPAIQIWNDQHDGLKAWNSRNVDATLYLSDLRSSTRHLNCYEPMWEKAIEDPNVISQLL